MNNIFLETNKKIGFLWFNTIKEGEVDSIENPTTVKTEIAEVNVQKANIFEILFLKYGIYFGLIYLLFNVNTYYVSMLGMAISISLYTIYYILYKNFGKRVLQLTLTPLPILYLLVTVIWFKDTTTYNLDFVFNYIFQYTASVFVIHKIVIDIAIQGYEGYYRAEGKYLRYVRFAKTAEEFETPAKLNKWLLYIFYSVTILIFIISTTIGVDGLLQKHVIEQKKAELSKNLNTEDLKHIKYLDDKADQLGMPRYHENIKGIQDYEEIELNTGTLLKVTYRDGTSKTSTYKNKTRKIKTYIKDDRWNFMITGSDNIYTVMNIRAR
jgi:hypothetical protein